ncbi:trifunctional hydroxymethylpyrimidine kinase/phosphomethylpyrimidine kinase/thiaminase, variant 2 [Basidiobolus ranarum]|uniref:Trifunctional hydroxymethylpyrimidine kinase/phosphomethylpyrimidine kinase/thiaminase, variant 2 n=1 Tax=Basidiobolus ranarum TaxID=34480 RepID=A0ABR2W762_9FUNG
MINLATEKRLPKALTIAGSDSGGGAGIQADIKTFTSLQVYGTSVLTAVTSQNSKGVNGVELMKPEFVRNQLTTVLSDIGADAIKTGMLGDAETMEVIVQVLKEHYKTTKPKLVVDPVMVSTSGTVLLKASSIQTLKHVVLPITYIVTPNVPEAEVLLSDNENNRITQTIETLDAMKHAAKEIASFGPKYVILKGGHLIFDQELNKVDPTLFKGEMFVIDVVYDALNDSYFEMRKPYIKSNNTHGTGCTLSAAIAAELANGVDTNEAIIKGIRYVANAIKYGFSVGEGHGSLNHYHSLVRLPISPPTSAYPYPLISYLIEQSSDIWESYVKHPFVEQLGNGTLPKRAFVHFLKQNYLYLHQYARACALASYKSQTISEIASAAKTVIEVGKEIERYLKLCLQWGVSVDELERTTEDNATVAYSRYILDQGHSSDAFGFKVALIPCMIGYLEMGLALVNNPNTKRGNYR